MFIQLFIRVRCCRQAVSFYGKVEHGLRPCWKFAEAMCHVHTGIHLQPSTHHATTAKWSLDPDADGQARGSQGQGTPQASPQQHMKHDGAVYTGARISCQPGLHQTLEETGSRRHHAAVPGDAFRLCAAADHATYDMSAGALESWPAGDSGGSIADAAANMSGMPISSFSAPGEAGCGSLHLQSSHPGPVATVSIGKSGSALTTELEGFGSPMQVAVPAAANYSGSTALQQHAAQRHVGSAASTMPMVMVQQAVTCDAQAARLSSADPDHGQNARSAAPEYESLICHGRSQSSPALMGSSPTNSRKVLPSFCHILLVSLPQHDH